MTMTTQQKIRSVRRKLHDLMKLRKPSVFIDPNDPIEKECMRLLKALCDHESKWKLEMESVDRTAIAKAKGL